MNYASRDRGMNDACAVIVARPQLPKLSMSATIPASMARKQFGGLFTADRYTTCDCMECFLWSAQYRGHRNRNPLTPTVAIIRSDQKNIGLLRVDKRNSTIDSRNNTRNNVE